MKEIYDWVPWFGELTRKISNGDEKYLIERAKRVNWGTDNPSLLRYGDENIDPFSFFYFIAQRNGHILTKKEAIYKSIDDVFEIDRKNLLNSSSLNDGFIIPTPEFRINPLFHYDGEGNPNILWKLFREATNGANHIEAENFKMSLEIKGVDVAKLTQCLFIINPDNFMPIDNGIFEFHNALGFLPFKKVRDKIRENSGWIEYQSIMQRFKSLFPECSFYEINTALYRMNVWGQEKIANKFFHISTNAENDGNDYWEEFSKGNYVRTGGIASDVGFGEKIKNIENPYPLTDPSVGDIILVRTGIKRGRAIGLVYKNDHAENNLTKENAIHVLWLNKMDVMLKGNTRQNALEVVHKDSETYRAFLNTEEYQPTFNVILNFCEPGQVIPPPLPEKVKVSHPLNKIFYGPPGTGKTYCTTDSTLKIVDPKFYESNKGNRDKLRNRFEELMGEQIEFVTFHQSFGYEEFVEGIRPIMGDGEENVSYEIKDGIFKVIAKKAEENLNASQREGQDFDIDSLISGFAEDIQRRMEENEEEIYLFKGKYEDISRSKTKIREVKISSNGDFRHFRIGTDGGVNQFLDAKIIKKNYLEFKKGKIKKSKDIPPTQISRVSWHGNHLYYFGILKHLSDFEKKEMKGSSDVGPVPLKKYVLVIDEINRGNISRIFGELITLIEDTKRLGEQEEMSVRLPYSEEPFGVPKNLHIIGTMNTADRSIALLDTALRRRFRFEEMMPDIEKLKGTKIDGIDVALMLEAINKNIEIEYDRDHQIGHSYFMRLKGNSSLETLEEIFRHEILPLLQEYFHDDWEKIKLVLNNNDFLLGEKIRNRDKTLWKINPDPFKVESYKKIYKKEEEDDDE